MLSQPKVKQAFDLSAEPERLRDAYGRTTYGQSCLLARRLVEAGVRFVTVYYSPVDRRQGQRRLGHPRRQLQPAQGPAAAEHRPGRADPDRGPPGARPARRDPGRLDGRVRPVAQGRRTPSNSAPTAATTGRTATRSSSPAAASSRARSTARATGSAPIPRPTPSRPTTSPRPCSGPWASTRPPRSPTPWAARSPSPRASRSRPSSVKSR